MMTRESEMAGRCQSGAAGCNARLKDGVGSETFRGESGVGESA